MLKAMSQFTDRLSRRRKQSIAMLADGVAMPAALWSALAVRLGEWVPEVGHFWPAFAVSLICIPLFSSLGLYRQVVRYMDSHAVWMVAKGAAIGALSIGVVAYMVPLAGFPRSAPILFCLLATLYAAGLRGVARAWFRRLRTHAQPSEPVIVYGAGRNGVELARLLARQGTYAPAAFLDDDKALHNRAIDGIRVHPRRALARLLRQTGARQILVAVDAGAKPGWRKVVRHLEPFGVRVRVIPSIDQLMRDPRAALPDARDLQIESLLGRDEVGPLPHLLKKSVQGRVVMVTGAGGSIGSELCRQIARQGPKQLVLLDHSEYGLFRMQRELEQVCAREGLDIALASVLGSVTNRAFVHQAIARHAVETLYHAAAYKHVNLVENNLIEGLKNNTFGTLHTAEAALALKVKHFILISTDKAVRTRSAMGASKRLAEMILQALQQSSAGTCFSVVRFGNVFGSSGSVVPLFIEQIENGGPVTVTHPDVTRYFMTIQEAAQLVLQAASLSRGGDIFLLDMGQPVKILELAARIAQVKGCALKTEQTPDGDIDVQFIGLRPGEKLHEELLMGEDLTGTEHRKIMRTEERFIPWPELRPALRTLEQTCDSYDLDAIRRFASGLIEGSDLNSQLGGLRPKAPVVRMR